MVVKQRSPTNAKAPLDMSRIPVWVDFMAVPDSLYAGKGLKFLGDIVGKYQKLHSSTEKCIRLDVARVLVEVNFETELIKTILLTEKEEHITTIYVSYPWVPLRCEGCKKWGHALQNCSKGSQQTQQKNHEGESAPANDPTSEKLPATDLDKEETMAPGHRASLNLTPSEATKVPEQTLAKDNEAATDEELGWETAKGRKSPRKVTSPSCSDLDVTISPNKYSVLQEDDIEDGEFVVQETNEATKSQKIGTEFETEAQSKDEEDVPNQLPSEQEPDIQATRDLQNTTAGGLRGGRGRGRPRKNTTSHSDVYAIANNKTIKASFGKH